MNIFDYIIHDKVITGISKMHTDFDESRQLKQFWFELYTTLGPIVIKSDAYDAGDSAVTERNAWTSRFSEVKESIGRMLEGPRPAHLSLVNDTFTSLVDHINAALNLLQPRNGVDEQKVQTHKERIFLNARKLKDLVAA